MVERDLKPTSVESPAAPPPVNSNNHGSNNRRRYSVSDDVWGTEDADIGITNVIPSTTADRGVIYEVSLRFPAAHKLWRIQRSFQDFADLHSALEARHRNALEVRRIYLPRPSRMSWDTFRSSGLDQAAERMMLKLNGYIHKLLEIEEIHTNKAFRMFFTPRQDSADSETQASLLPSITVTAGTTRLSEVIELKTNCKETPAQFPRATTNPVKSQCDHVIYYGAGMQLRALGGLKVGLTKRSALSGSQKAVAVAAGVAGVALTGPFSAVLAIGALGGGVGKYQMNKTYYLTVGKSHSARSSRNSGSLTSSPNSPSSPSQTRGSVVSATSEHNECFVIENAGMFSSPRRPVKFGDLIHFFCKSVRKSVRISQPPDSKRGHLMVTNEESNMAMMRFVSPYGYRGPVVCGSHVYIQVLNGNWANQVMGLHGDFIATGNSPTVFKLCVHEHMCQASEEAIPIPRPLPLRPLKLRVMVYNVWLMPSILTSINGKLSPSTNQRAEAIPRCLASMDLDVVVFCEAFDPHAREILTKGMKEFGFLYETKVVGGSSVANKKVIDGGTFAMSRFPLEQFQETTFGSVAVGDDRVADKGVIYFQTRVNNEVVHVFGTHLQAWNTPVAIGTRRCQLKRVREYMENMKISKDDVVVIVGDLNVNQCGNQEAQREYIDMLNILEVQDPPLVPSSSPYSFDPTTNNLAVAGPSSGGETERLDYVLIPNMFRQPAEVFAEVVQLKATKDWRAPMINTAPERLVDLSDHYPVVCELRYETSRL
ncbi:TPA: hypothetical protein N0F65_008403 [Lagenidium giganteum]|uniref:sphingomyelin phosphodiesterase n=1 Tax=Lagenidium giganteum TaxID=4803 RepID=A0AAV2Z124_9STRA|nr:TPA: hypothetical protein N0F65_008403 [Lagenidium giganteum]